MQSATLWEQLGAARDYEQQALPVNARASLPVPDPPGERLKLAKGSLVAIVLSTGLWAAIIGCISFLRH